MVSRMLHAAVAYGIVAACGAAFGQPFAPRDSSGPFINWETPHVHPLDKTPNGQSLLAVNTADNRLEVFSIASGVPVRTASIPVGLDPCSVRARSDTEAWVVNHISDSVSIVSLTSLNVIATIKTADEPWDVVFATGPMGQRAFVSCTLRNRVQVFETTNLSMAPMELFLDGEMPRALAVNAAGTRVYAAIFESGNHSTVLGGGAVSNIGFPPNVVSRPEGPYGGQNPPPYTGTATGAPAVGLIVKKTGNQWLDGAGADWTNLVSGPQASLSGRPVGWDLYDRDLAVIDSSTLTTSYATGLMNICMAMAVNPASGAITVVGTDATNQIRFEPVLKGKFLRVNIASVDPSTLTGTPVDLNPHLVPYSSSTIPQVDRDRSIGDPRAIVWDSTGTRGYVAGMGSNNVLFINAAGGRGPSPNLIEVGEGPTGLVLDEPHSSLYVLNKFGASITVIDTNTRAASATVPLFDPTPTAIKVGRKHLYDTHKNSGLGHIACASCHVDARFDRLGWDLGDPNGTSTAVSTTNRNLGQGLPGLSPGTTNPPFASYHPMKGPMTTQTLQDIIGKEPHHWRGDRLGIEEFNPAFQGLQGDDVSLTTGPAGEMQQFEDFLATITFPPNPYRNFNNTLPTNLPLPGHYSTGERSPAGTQLPNGDAIAGRDSYRSATTRLDGGAFACVTCHTLPTGAGTDTRSNGLLPPNFAYVPIAPGPNGERHLSLVSVDGVSNVTMKTPQLRNLYQKVGFNMTQTRNTAGFGVLHDGSVDSLERFIDEPVFNINSDQLLANLVAFVLALSGSDFTAPGNNQPFDPPGPPSRDSHAAVGVQTTAAATADAVRINEMVTEANNGKVSIVAKGLVAGKQRGYAYIGSGNWQADRQGEVYTTAALTALASAGSEITFTVVPSGSQTRIGIDRDLDGYYDRNELDVCSNPADPSSRPGTVRSTDFNGDLTIGVQDLFDFLAAYFAGAADFNGDGMTTVQDIFDYLAAWFGCTGA